MFYKTITSATALCFLVSACSTSEECVPNPLNPNQCKPDPTVTTTGTTENDDGSTTTLQNLFGNTSFDIDSITYDDNGTASNADDRLTIVGGDFDAAGGYRRAPALDRGGMLGFESEFREPNGDGVQRVGYTALFGQTPSGEMSVSLAATGDYAGHGDYFAGFERDATSDLPQTGNANYEGTYAGVLTYENTGGMALTEGSVLVEVEFQDNFRTKGVIYDRTVVSGDIPVGRSENLPAISLGESNFADSGIFSGGAGNIENGEPLERGEYSGTMGGPNASEVVGYVRVTAEDLDARPGVGTQEIGVFTAECVEGNPQLVCTPATP